MERHLAAILSADVAGYSLLVEDDDEATVRTLQRYREIMRTLINAHQGRVVDAPGDNLLAEFPSVIEAVRSAVEIQRALRRENDDIEPHRQMSFRIGISVGDVVVEDDQLFGDGVNIAARVESLADPGGICLSSSAYEQCENKVELEFEFLGAHSVKNMSKPIPVWRAVLDDYRKRTAQQSTVGNRSRSRSATTLRRRLMVAGLTVLIGLVAFQALREPSPVGTTDSRSPVALIERPAIIVLPFENLSDDPDQAYFSNGITEDITTDLSRIDDIFVVPSAAAKRFTDEAIDPAKLREEFGIRYLLEGSVRKANDKVRVSARLVDVVEDHHIWAERYDRALDDIFALQDDLRQKILTALRVNLNQQEQAAFRRAPTTDLEAYDFFLRAREMSRRARKELRPQLMDEAAALYQKAIDLDPDYGAAYGALAIHRWLASVYGWSETPLDDVLALLEKAVTLGDSNPHTVRYLLRIRLENREYDKALAASNEYVQQLPNDPFAHQTRAYICLFAGLYQQAVESMEEAKRLFPRLPPWAYWQLGTAYQLVNRDEEALSVLSEGTTRAPNYLTNQIALVGLYAKLGRFEDAKAQAQEILRISPDYHAADARRLLPFKEQAITEQFVRALRAAGIP